MLKKFYLTTALFLALSSVVTVNASTTTVADPISAESKQLAPLNLQKVLTEQSEAVSPEKMFQFDQFVHTGFWGVEFERAQLARLALNGNDSAASRLLDLKFEGMTTSTAQIIPAINMINRVTATIQDYPANVQENFLGLSLDAMQGHRTIGIQKNLPKALEIADSVLNNPKVSDRAKSVAHDHKLDIEYELTKVKGDKDPNKQKWQSICNILSNPNLSPKERLTALHAMSGLTLNVGAIKVLEPFLSSTDENIQSKALENALEILKTLQYSDEAQYKTMKTDLFEKINPASPSTNLILLKEKIKDLRELDDMSEEDLLGQIPDVLEKELEQAPAGIPKSLVATLISRAMRKGKDGYKKDLLGAFNILTPFLGAIETELGVGLLATQMSIIKDLSSGEKKTLSKKLGLETGKKLDATAYLTYLTTHSQSQVSLLGFDQSLYYLLKDFKEASKYEMDASEEKQQIVDLLAKAQNSPHAAVRAWAEREQLHTGLLRITMSPEAATDLFNKYCTFYEEKAGITKQVSDTLTTFNLDTHQFEQAIAKLKK